MHKIDDILSEIRGLEGGSTSKANGVRSKPEPEPELYSAPQVPYRGTGVSEERLDRFEHLCHRVIQSLEQFSREFTESVQTLRMVMVEMSSQGLQKATAAPPRRPAPSAPNHAPAPVSVPVAESTLEGVDSFQSDTTVAFPDEHFVLEAIATAEPLKEERNRGEEPTDVDRAIVGALLEQ